MKLQAKTTLIVASSFIAAGALVVGLFTKIILSEFEKLEDLQVADNMSRVEEAFKQEVVALLSRGKDWAMWDDAHSFVANANNEFIEANLTYQILEPLEFEHVAFFNKDLKLVHGVRVDRRAESAVPLPPDFIQYLFTSSAFQNAPKRDQLGGFISIGGQNFILAITQVTDSAGQAEPSGFLVITKEVTDEFVGRLAHMTRVRLVALQPARNPQPHVTGAPFDYSRAFVRLPVLKAHDFIKATCNIYDVVGAPFLTLQASFDRSLYFSALDTRRFFSGMFALVCVSLCCVVLLLMRLMVVGPIKRLVFELAEISGSSDFGRTIKLVSRDELGTLTNQINDTLRSLEQSLERAEKAQQSAEMANKAKTSFIAKVSHELRTPIHSITGMLRILLKEERASAKRNYIVMARNSAYGLLETINEILDFSKVEAGKLVLERIEFSIHDVIREAIRTVGPRIEEKGSLEAFVEIPQGIPDKLIGDPLRLRQILINLLGNATKFTKAGQIGLHVSKREIDRAGAVLLELTVSDTGVGIPADRLDYIFEPFGQADESVSRMFTGTGLGLTIVKQVVEGMGGTVRVESEFGVGSRFILNIPFVIAHGAQPLVHRLELKRPRIVIFGSNSIVEQQYAKMLAEEGFTAEIIRADDLGRINEISGNTSQYGMIIATSEALKRSRIFDLVVELRGRGALPVVAVLSAFEISVRERLLALNVPFVVTRPISTFDILGFVSGQYSLQEDVWQDAEDTSLQSERPLEILIADDAQTNRIILTELLRDAGHNVVCVENGEELVAKISDSFNHISGAPQFDLVLTDVQMPLLDGLSATAKVRAMERSSGAYAHLPIVAVTAHAMTDEIGRMRQYGVDDIVTKPLDPIKLGEVIRKLTGQQTRERCSRASGEQKQALSPTELYDLGLRLWAQVARHGDDMMRLFALSEDPSSPEDFQRVLDIADVVERSGDSVRRTLLIFRGFLESFRGQLQKLGEAKQERNAEKLRFVAHALKGLLLDVGGRASGNLASSIEQMCKDGAAEEAYGHVSTLTNQVLLVARLIAQLTDSVSTSPSQQAGVSQIKPPRANAPLQ